MKLRTLLLCAALAASGACHSNDANKKADEAAQNLDDKTNDLQKTAQKNADDVVHASTDQARAASDFTVRRDQAVAGYRAELKIYQASLPAAHALLADPALAQTDRDNANDKIGMFERECNLAEQTFDALATSTSTQWDQSSSAAEQQMQKVRDTHDDAFSALSVERKLPTTAPATDKTIVPSRDTTSKTKIVPVPQPVPVPMHSNK